MSQDKVVFRAALARALLGLFGIAVLPLMYPATTHLWPVFVAYLALVAAFQWLIRKRIGGSVRALAGGLVDLALLTAVVQRVGSGGTVLLAIYLFAGMINAVVTPPRVAMALSVLGGLAYAIIIAMESTGLIPYGPDGGAWQQTSPPPLGHALTQAAVLGTLSVFATAIVVQLVRAVRGRERALVAANSVLEETSRRDPLTQLYNRRHLLERLQDELPRVVGGHALGVLMLDLDGFKRVNDETGHLRGDALLKEIAEALQKHCRSADVPARYGGDEFVVLLPGTDATGAAHVAERVRHAVCEVGLRFDARRPVTASVGVVQARAHEEVAALLRRADQNAYQAKQSGGNRVAA